MSKLRLAHAYCALAITMFIAAGLIARSGTANESISDSIVEMMQQWEEQIADLRMEDVGNNAKEHLDAATKLLEESKRLVSRQSSEKLKENLAEAQLLVDLSRITVQRSAAEGHAKNMEESAEAMEAQSVAAAAIADALERHLEDVEEQIRDLEAQLP